MRISLTGRQPQERVARVGHMALLAMAPLRRESKLGIASPLTAHLRGGQRPFDMLRLTVEVDLYQWTAIYHGVQLPQPATPQLMDE